MNLPKLLIIGAPRCGTSTLFDMLCQVSGFWGKVKEIHFFNRHWNKGIQYYAKEFKDAPANSILFEATPFYLASPKTPERIKNILPDVKIVALLREPVARCVSHYWWNQDKFGNDPEILIDVNHHCVKHGHYAEHLERWFEYFPREQLLAIASESFFELPTVYAQHVIHFAGMSTDNTEFKRTYCDPLEWRKNKYGPPQVSKKVCDWLRSHYKPHNKRLAELLMPCRVINYWDEKEIK